MATKKEKEEGFYKSHTVEVKINGESHRVAKPYLNDLKKKFGKNLEVVK